MRGKFFLTNSYSGSILSLNIPSTEINCEEFSTVDVNKFLTNRNLVFTKNKGQIENDEVQFYCQGGGIWFTTDGVWFEIREEVNVEDREVGMGNREWGIGHSTQHFDTADIANNKMLDAVATHAARLLTPETMINVIRL